MAKRKALAERYPSGRVKTTRQVEAMTGVLWQRMLRLRRDTNLDPRMTCEIAWLHGLGALENQHVVVAHKIAEIYGRFERLISRSRSVKGFSYEIGRSGLDLPTDEQEAARDEREKKARTAFDALQADMDVLPRDLREAIETLCVEDRHVLPIWHEDFRRFFGKLAIKWRVVAGARRGGARENSGPKGRGAALDAKSQVIEKSPEAAKPKVNIDRIVVRQLHRAIQNGLPESESYDFFLAARDKVAYRAKQDQRRELKGLPPSYAPPAAEITAAAAITNRPSLNLPGNSPETMQ